MTEAYEDDEPYYEDGDLVDVDARNELADLREQIEQAAADQEVNAIVGQIERVGGYQFSDAEWQAVGERIASGWTPDDAVADVAPQGNFETDFLDTVERLQSKEGRTLTEKETDRLWERALDSGDPTDLEGAPLLDMGSSTDRAAYLDQRMNPTPEAPETVEPLADDATAKDREAYYEARVAGAEIDDDGF